MCSGFGSYCVFVLVRLVSNIYVRNQTTTLMNIRTKFYLIIALTLFVAVIALPREDRVFSALGIKNGALKVRQGLDLQGGASLTYQADLSKLKAEEKQKAIAGVIDVVNKRVNPSGTSEVVIQTSGSDRVSVQLPGVTDVNQAIALIGKTAQLDFYRVPPGSTTPVPTQISGKDLASVAVDFDPQSAQPVVSFELKGGDATKKFAELTTQINKESGRLAIVLDGQALFNGTVSTPITDGRGQLQGFESLKVAQETSVLLNAGALPVPVKLVEQRTVGATLGSESITKSLVAGLIGILAVMIFMIAYYRLAGVVASIALVIYTLINLAYFKFSVFMPGFFIFSPIVLTLAGIAGFILSVGMAVDANILIFERMKEEVRNGKDMPAALKAGFSRAWDSIRDSNISTLITCLILYWFGVPIIKGFAVTLGLGVIISMFTAITVSRTLMGMLITTKVGQNPRNYGYTEEGKS